MWRLSHIDAVPVDSYRDVAFQHDAVPMKIIDGVAKLSVTVILKEAIEVVIVVAEVADAEVVR